VLHLHFSFSFSSFWQRPALILIVLVGVDIFVRSFASFVSLPSWAVDSDLDYDILQLEVLFRLRVSCFVLPLCLISRFRHLFREFMFVSHLYFWLWWAVISPCALVFVVSVFEKCILHIHVLISISCPFANIVGHLPCSCLFYSPLADIQMPLFICRCYYYYFLTLSMTFQVQLRWFDSYLSTQIYRLESSRWSAVCFSIVQWAARSHVHCSWKCSSYHVTRFRVGEV